MKVSIAWIHCSLNCLTFFLMKSIAVDFSLFSLWDLRRFVYPLFVFWIRRHYRIDGGMSTSLSTKRAGLSRNQKYRMYTTDMWMAYKLPEVPKICIQELPLLTKNWVVYPTLFRARNAKLLSIWHDVKLSLEHISCPHWAKGDFYKHTNTVLQILSVVNIQKSLLIRPNQRKL